MRWLKILNLFLGGLLAVSAGAQTMSLSVDATDAPRGVYHARVQMPAAPGPLSLAYPKWIPGDHAPDGPIVDLTGLRFEAAGQPLAWRRDPGDMFSFAVEVPQGAAELVAHLDFVGPPDGGSTSPKLAIVNWNEVLLYPSQAAAAQLQVRASLKLPEGWKLASALPLIKTEGLTSEFQAVSLETLIDSPVLAGAHLKTYELGSGNFLDVAADAPESLELKPAALQNLKNLVAEAHALFGGQAYRQYHFLLSLSDGIAHYGLEHHESSDNRTKENFLTDEDAWTLGADLLTHEYFHSWNGKFRRPQGLAVRNYQDAYDTSLLWVYEGMTEYYAMVLAARAGFRTPEQFRDNLARTADGAAAMRAGRTWRPLQDTTVAAQLLYTARSDWDNWRRSTDFYEEGILLWLAVDVKIREATQGKRSLDDFCRAFFAGTKGAPEVRPYSRQEVLDALTQAAALDWDAFLTEKTERPVPAADLAKLELGGWKLVYRPERNEMQSSAEGEDDQCDLMPALGLKLSGEGEIKDVLWGGASDKAGLAPGMKVLAVDGREYSAERLRRALAQAPPTQFELLIKHADFFKTFKLGAIGAEKYPALEQDASRPDTLAGILRPLAATPAPAPPEPNAP